MKPNFAAIAVVLSLLSSPLLAAEASAEQQFKNADLELAIAQYKQLRTTAFELGLKLQVERTQSDEECSRIDRIRSELLANAQQLRREALKAAAETLAKAR